jgi:SH3-like domain-containing protein
MITWKCASTFNLLAIKRNAAPLCAAFLLVAPVVLIAPGHSNAQAPAPVVTPKPVAVPGLSAPLQVPPTATPVSAPTNSFGAIADKPAIIFDAPSAKAQKIFVFSRNMPVEILVRLDKWIKVRDAENAVGWVESSALGTSRFVQVSADIAQIRETASAASPLAFEAQRAVLLEVIGTTTQGFVPVRHRDGPAGFVLKSQIWGN